jgi:hypothetical protein
MNSTAISLTLPALTNSQRQQLLEEANMCSLYGVPVVTGQKPTLRIEFLLSAVYLPCFHQYKSVLSTVEVINCR